MFERGFVTIARYRGAPIRLHWTVPLGALLFTRLRFAPGAWLGIVLLVILHELGHAVLVRWRGLSTVSIDVTGLGGLCRYEGEPTMLSRAIIAWGGVWAQMLVLGLTVLAVLALGLPSSPFLLEMIDSFLWPNLFIIGLNLVPIAPLDGADAWKLPGLLWRRWRKRRAHRKVERARAALARVDQGDIEETVREALDRARREASGSAKSGSD